MCLTWAFSETTFQKGRVCSVLLEHCAFSAWPWCAGVLVPLQLPAALVCLALRKLSAINFCTDPLLEGSADWIIHLSKIFLDFLMSY